MITVGPQATADFAELQNAVNAAEDGDTLLVRSGSYVPTTIDAKGLTIIGIPSPDRPRVIELTIRNIAAHQTVVVRGIDTHGVLFSSPYFMSIDHCLGPVTIEDCRLDPTGGLWPYLWGGQPLTRVEASTNVLFSRCTIKPPAPSPMAPIASMALRVVGSHVAVYDSKITGGSGVDAALFNANESCAGAAAVELVSGSLLLAGCVMTGGRGGNGTFGSGDPCFATSDGGDGVVATGGVIRLMDSVVVGGAGGVTKSSCPNTAQPGVPTLATGGSIVTIPETLRRLDASSPVFEGGAGSIVFKGVPGEPVLLLLGTSAKNAYLPGLQSTLHPAAPFLAIKLGFVPQSGTIAFSFAIPKPLLPAGIEGITMFEQCLVPGNSGLGLLSAPSTQTVVLAGL